MANNNTAPNTLSHEPSYKVGADHYILNSTTVVLLSKSWKGVQENVEINYDVVEMLLESAYDILDYLEKHY